MVHKLRKGIFPKLFAVLLCFILALTALLPAAPPVQAQEAPANKVYGVSEIEKIIEGIINWKKADNGSRPEDYLINNSFLDLAGTEAGDWYPFGLGRYGYPDNNQGYLAMITEVVQNKYQQPGKLSAVKATEWHRISLAILAMGGDPTAVGKDQNGKPINLIADGIYNRGKTASLGKQGINGWIWGLIALDAKNYKIPAGASYSRSDIITEILRQQLKDGGFALTDDSSDPDITAMALQALAPCYNSTQTYTYQREATGQKTTRTVKQVVDEALAWLAKAQLPSGDYEGWGARNLESTAQVAVALCSLGIDPQKDQRFIKNGVSLLDGMLGYRRPDGGFLHSKVYDSDNPTSEPDKSNSLAGEQALYSFVAVWRQMKGLSPLYNFSSDEKALTSGGSKPKLLFSAADRARVEALPVKLTTEQYVEVISLLAKLEQSADFQGKADYLARLMAAKQKIVGIQAEIDSINQDILAKLYPFEQISLADRGTVNTIAGRYAALSPYDQKKVLHWEDVVKTKTKLDDLARALYITLVLAGLGIVAAVLLLRRIKRRQGKKAREMEELAAQCEEKDSQ